MTGATRCLVAANLLLIMSQFTHLTITAVRSYFCGELPFDNLYFVYRWRFLMNPTASFSVRFFVDHNFDRTGVSWIAKLSYKLGVKSSTDVKSKVQNVYYTSLNL